MTCVNDNAHREFPLVVEDGELKVMTTNGYKIALGKHVQQYYRAWLASKIVGGELDEQLRTPLFV